MAILNEDEEDFKTKETAVSGGTSFIGGGSSTAAAPNTPKAPVNQGGFTNIVNYLQSPNSGDRMAADVVGGLDKTGQQAQYSSDIYGRNLGQAVAAGTPSFSPTEANKWMQETSPDENTKQEVAKTGQAPTVTFNKPAPSSAYTGPTGYSEGQGYGQAVSDVQKVKDKSSSLGTFGGVQNELSDRYGYGKGTGLSKLDAALTMYGKGAAPMQAGLKKWSNIGDYLGGWEKQGQQAIESAKTTAKSVGDQWAAAQQKAQTNAAATNKIYSKIAEDKKTADQKAAEWKAGEQAREAERQRQGEENTQWGKQYLDKADEQSMARMNWIGNLQPGGLKDGWLWSQEDITNYIKTGQKPNRPKVASSGAYSTSEGYF